MAMSEPPDSGQGATDSGEQPGPTPRAKGPADGAASRKHSNNSTASANRRGAGATTADRVGTIVAAAEQAAEQIRVRTEGRVRDRIAEADRAADYRVRAAESEALEIVKNALEQAEQSKTVATSEALRIVTKAREEAEATKTASTSQALELLAKAEEEADASTTKAKAQSREILGEARVVAADVRSEGMELVQNLREMGNSLRSNAELLLRDIQAVHSRMVSELDRVDGGGGQITPPRAIDRESRPSRRPRAPERPAPIDGELDIPEFIPPG